MDLTNHIDVRMNQRGDTQRPGEAGPRPRGDRGRLLCANPEDHRRRDERSSVQD